ncbi:PIN domain-containing protein [Streptomyces sp. bgisy027]|uniref:PIN domain-containing protein n=1 Tax=Streptomyces sp. bgisy027 TaxID=3413770 RepID=UPI003D74A441
MAFVAIYDANVLYPSTLRDVLIRIAQGGLVQAKWTDQILDETFRNLLKNHQDIPPEKFDRVRALMNAAIRDCLVRGHEPLIDAVKLPDPDDRHVLAAAIRAKAQVVVTFNLKDFPTEALAPWDVEAVHPDASWGHRSIWPRRSSTARYKESRTVGESRQAQSTT